MQENEKNVNKKGYSRFSKLGLVGHYDFLTEKSREEHSREEVKMLDTADLFFENKENYPERFKLREELYREILAMEYITEKHPELLVKIKNVDDLTAVFNSEPVNGVYRSLKPKSNGELPKEPFVNSEGAFLSHRYIGYDMHKRITSCMNSIQFYKNKSLGTFFPVKLGEELVEKISNLSSAYKELKNLKGEDYNKKLAEINGLRITSDMSKKFFDEVDKGRKIVGLREHLVPYMNNTELANLAKEADPLNAHLKKAMEFYDSVDLEAQVVYVNKQGKESKYTEVKCSGGHIMESQLNQIVNSRRAAFIEAKTSEKQAALEGKLLSRSDIEDILKEWSEQEKTVRNSIKSMSYDLAEKEINLLPISKKQEFVANVILGVPKKELENLNREDAKKLIEEVSGKIRNSEVGPEIRAYAEHYNLVKPGEKFTYSQWDAASYKVPPMDNMKEMVYNLNLESKVHWYEERKKKVSHKDYVNIITSYLNNYDDKVNGPVEPYQIKAVPEAALFSKWQEAEKKYLERCVTQKLLGYDEAFYVLSGKNNDLRNETQKLLDENISVEDRKKMSVDVRDKIREHMAEDRIGWFNRSRDYVTAADKKDVRKCVFLSVKRFYDKKFADYVVVNTANYVKAGINREKDFADEYVKITGKDSYTEKEIKSVASEIYKISPSVIGEEGTYAEKINRIVETIKPSFDDRMQQAKIDKPVEAKKEAAKKKASANKDAHKAVHIEF